MKIPIVTKIVQKAKFEGDCAELGAKGCFRGNRGRGVCGGLWFSCGILQCGRASISIFRGILVFGGGRGLALGYNSISF